MSDFLLNVLIASRAELLEAIADTKHPVQSDIAERGIKRSEGARLVAHGALKACGKWPENDRFPDSDAYLGDAAVLALLEKTIHLLENKE